MQGLRLLIAGGGGAALSYFLDPDRGRRRRMMARDRATALLRRIAKRAERAGRHTIGAAYGVSHRATRLAGHEAPRPNDATLTQRVRSAVFRSVPGAKGQVNINAECGTIVLRGVVASPRQIEALETATRQIPGVVEVENLLHLPHTPCPHHTEIRGVGAIDEERPRVPASIACMPVLVAQGESGASEVIPSNDSRLLQLVR